MMLGFALHRLTSHVSRFAADAMFVRRGTWDVGLIESLEVTR